MWGIGDLYRICLKRQANKFDVIIGWSGSRGNGKSTGAYKLGKRYKCFKPWEHLTYSRKEDMNLMEQNKFIYIQDDEAIRGMYKRNFQDPEQKTLVQMLNMFRSHSNVYSFCIPSFYGLDKDLRSLTTIHIHVIERGLAVVHLPREDVLYSDDPWDIAYNQKIESQWARTKKHNPYFKPPYHKLSTFAGYLKYGKLTAASEKLYEEIKESKRKEIYETQMLKEMNGKEDKRSLALYDSIAKRIVERYNQGKLVTQSEFEELVTFSGKSLAQLMNGMHMALRSLKVDKTITELIEKNVITKKSKPLILERRKLPIAT